MLTGQAWRRDRRRFRSGVVAGLLVAATAGPGVAQPPAPGAPGPAPAGRPPAPRVYDLKQAIETALQRHPALATVQARSQAARTGTAVAGAQHRPFFEGQAIVGKTLAGDRNVGFRDEGAVETARSDPFYTAFLGLVVPIVREGRLVIAPELPGQEVARARHETVRLGEQLTRVQVVGHVVVAFFTALSAAEEVRAGERVVALHRMLVDHARLRQQQELAPPAEVLAAEAGLAAAEAGLAAARAGHTGSLLAFAGALGLEPAPDLLRDLSLVPPEGPGPGWLALEELLRQAAERHPAVQVQQARLAEEQARVRLLNTERYPTLDATARIGTLDDFSTPQDRWSFRTLLRLNWRIFDLGALDLRLRQQAEVVEAERRALDETRHQIAQAVIAAHRTLTATHATLTSLGKAVELAEERARVARERFQQNLAAEAEVLRARVDLEAARKARTQAGYAVWIEHARLQVALGAP